MLERVRKKISKKKNPVDVFLELENILRGGVILHAFRSGGGLRVVSLKRGVDAKGYGEHPALGEAISHAVEDFLAGGRPYKEVYGKIHDHYLTGAYAAVGGNLTLMDLLDRHVSKGHPLDASYKDGKILVELTNPYYMIPTPLEVMEKAFKGETVKWSSFGKDFVTKPVRLGNGEVGCSTSPGAESLTVIKRGFHETFLGAVVAAIEDVGFIKENVRASQ